MIKRTPEFDLADQIIRTTNQNLFLTGKAGTGKTTFLKALKRDCPKRMVVLAPTGVAAINAGGMTIHSFFQFSFGPFIPEKSKTDIQKFRKEKINIIRTLDLLVIDEISMVRADLLDEIDDLLRKVRRTSVPFGGVQLLMIGDPQQLAPVALDDEWALLQPYYQTPYFFDSIALNESGYSCVELKTIFRQSDEMFIDLLNRVRENRVDRQTIEQLNARYVPDFKCNPDDGYIQLTTHNRTAQQINDSELEKINSDERTYMATLSGNFPSANYPTDLNLRLKVGAQVMFVKNDSSEGKRFYNGKIGTVKEVGEKTVTIYDKENHTDIVVEDETWENIKYVLNTETNEIEEKVEGKFEQLPLKTAWAITIHKSQGLTFDKAVIDAKDSFSHGQVYVALSRCRTFEGMVLSTPLNFNSFKHDRNVENFKLEMEKRTPCKEVIDQLQKNFFLQQMQDLCSFDNLYTTFFHCSIFLKSTLHKSYPKLTEEANRKLPLIEEKIKEVAQRFEKQLSQLCVQHTDDYKKVLNERLQKAIPYFIENCETLIQPILSQFLTATTDNKAYEKKLAELQNNLKSAYSLKIHLLEFFRATEEEAHTFSPESYSKERTNYILGDSKNTERENKKNKKEGATSKESTQDVMHPDLYEVLRQWRKEKADELSAPAYVVLSNQSLIAISNYLPETAQELHSLHGIGKEKMEKFGNDILSIVKKEVKKHGYQRGAELPEPPKKKKEKKEATEAKTNTYETTHQLFQQGKNAEEIAQERGMATSTIISHLAQLVMNKILPLSAFSSESRIKVIQAHILQHPQIENKEVFDHFQGEYSYAEIKVARWLLKN